MQQCLKVKISVRMGYDSHYYGQLMYSTKIGSQIVEVSSNLLTSQLVETVKATIIYEEQNSCQPSNLSATE